MTNNRSTEFDAAVIELAVQRLSMGFTDAVNRRNTDDIGALFTPDGVWYVPGLPTTSGRKDIAALAFQLMSPSVYLLQLLHGGLVTVQGPDRAAGRWYMTEQSRDASGTGWTWAGLFTDEYTKTPEGWLISSRRFDPLYRGQATMNGETFPYPGLVETGD